MIRVLIVDDHTIVRQGLKQILAETSDIVVTAEAQNGPEAIEKVRQNGYDVVLLDVALPGADGLSIMRVLRQEKPLLAVLVLSAYPEEQFAARFLKAGAAGYLTKESASDELILAIRKVARGGKYVTQSLAERLAGDLASNADKPPHETLSDREYLVMRMIASGKTAGEIAEELSLSVKTVSTYRARILKKLRLSNNADIMRYALTRGVVKW
jgi:DNA-binding NarL/FixJ family response regulator